MNSSFLVQQAQRNTSLRVVDPNSAISGLLRASFAEQSQLDPLQHKKNTKLKPDKIIKTNTPPKPNPEKKQISASKKLIHLQKYQTISQFLRKQCAGIDGEPTFREKSISARIDEKQLIQRLYKIRPDSKCFKANALAQYKRPSLSIQKSNKSVSQSFLTRMQNQVKRRRQKQIFANSLAALTLGTNQVLFRPTLTSSTNYLKNSPPIVNHTASSRTRCQVWESANSFIKQTLCRTADFQSYLQNDSNYIFQQSIEKKVNRISPSREQKINPGKITRGQLIRQEAKLKQLKQRNKQLIKKQIAKAYKRDISKNYYSRLINQV